MRIVVESGKSCSCRPSAYCIHILYSKLIIIFHFKNEFKWYVMKPITRVLIIVYLHNQLGSNVCYAQLSLYSFSTQSTGNQPDNRHVLQVGHYPNIWDTVTFICFYIDDSPWEQSLRLRNMAAKESNWCITKTLGNTKLQ